jgi:hypothetical protein
LALRRIPAVNGHGSARSIAEIHCILANGGVASGKRFMSEGGCLKALEQQIEGPDLVKSHHDRTATSVMTSEGELSAQCGGKTRIENRRGRI